MHPVTPSEILIMKNGNKAKDEGYVIIGKIGSTFGIKGWLKIHSFAEFGPQILEYKPWYISSSGNDDWEIVDIEAGEIHGKGVIAKIAGVETPEQARLFTGKLIGMERSQLPKLKKNEYYWSELEGLTVIDQHGAILGKVIYIMETGSNDVLVVKGDKEHAIPYLPGKVVLDVDLEKQEILVDWEII